MISIYSLEIKVLFIEFFYGKVRILISRFIKTIIIQMYLIPNCYHKSLKYINFQALRAYQFYCIIFMQSSIYEKEDHAISNQFNPSLVNNISTLVESSTMNFLDKRGNPNQYIIQAPSFSRVKLEKNNKLKALKYSSQRKISPVPQRPGNKGSCTNEKCRICKKLKPIADKKYLEFLNRRKIKPSLPPLPYKKSPTRQSQQQLQLLFDQKGLKNGRRAKSVFEPKADQYFYHTEERPRYPQIRLPNLHKYYTEQEDPEPEHKYIKINGKVYQIIQRDKGHEEEQSSYLPSFSHKRINTENSRVGSALDQKSNWKHHREEQKKQSEELNRKVEKYIKMQTMFFRLQNQLKPDQIPNKKKQKEPQKMTLYRLKDSSEQNQDLFQTIYDRQLSKNIEVAEEQQAQIYNIKFPGISQVETSISTYESLTGQINIQVLKKSKNYFREYSDESGKEFLYFGGYDHERRQRKGFGVLVTKKSILQGVWMKNFIVKGAQLKANSLYKGEFSNNKKHGEGTCKWLNGEQYMGQWSNGLRNGQGFWSSKNGKETYSGEWKNGKVFGYGEYFKKQVSFYKGNFSNFVKNGFGFEQFTNGDKYEGKYLNGMPEGTGVYIWECGLKYEGQFHLSERQGKGKLTMPGLFELDGTFEKEKPHGICQLKLCNMDIFNGKYIYGEKYGYGKLQNNERGIYREGFWNHGILQEQINSGNKEIYR